MTMRVWEHDLPDDIVRDALLGMDFRFSEAVLKYHPERQTGNLPYLVPITSEPAAKPVMRRNRGIGGSRLVAEDHELAFKGDLCSGPSWRLIVKLVAARHRITVESILSTIRAPQIARARFEAMWLLRTHTSMSYYRIGELFGRDHTTARHAIETYAKRAHG